MRAATLVALVALSVGGCSSGAPAGGHGMDAGPSPSADSGQPAHESGHGDAAKARGGSDAGVDEGGGDAGAPCSVDGNPGQCMEVSACAALADRISTPGYCPGPSSIECCTPTPNVADNPPIPVGYKLMQQADVTSAMTTWAVAILDDPATYPMFATTTRTFGSLTVLARVEWHPPDFNNSAVHRGVTLYEPI